MQVKSKVWLEAGGGLCFGSGRALILRAVDSSGSLSGAARSLGMSYRHVWSQVHSAEERLGRPLLERRRGGRDRGGAVLTPFAFELLERFDVLAQHVREVADAQYQACFPPAQWKGGAS